MTALNGAISLKELMGLPLKQYEVLRRAVDVAEFERRKIFIHDVAMAFSDPSKAISGIDEILNKINKKARSTISWDSDKSAIERAKKKWMR